MFVALNHSQLATKDKEVANSISPLFRTNNTVKTPKILNSNITCSKLKYVFPKFKNSVKNSHLERKKDKICGQAVKLNCNHFFFRGNNCKSSKMKILLVC